MGVFLFFRRVSGLSAGKTVFLSVMMTHHDAEQMPRKILFEDGSWHLQTEWQDEEQGSCRNRSGTSLISLDISIYPIQRDHFRQAPAMDKMR